MFKYHPTRRALLAAGALSLTAPRVFAQDPVRIGLIAEMSGPFAEFGRQMQGGITVYQKQFGDTVAGRKVEVIIKDVGAPTPNWRNVSRRNWLFARRCMCSRASASRPMRCRSRPLPLRPKCPWWS